MPIAPCLTDATIDRERDARVALTEMLQLLLQTAVDAEAHAACQASPFQRTHGRAAHRTGSYHRQLPSPFGGGIVLRLPRLSIEAHQSALLPPGTRRLDHVAVPLIRLAIGHNSWSAVQQLIAPWRARHGEADWLNRLAQRILACAEQRRRPPMPVVACQLHVAGFTCPGSDIIPGLHRVQAVTGNGRCSTWFVTISEPDGWSRLAQALHEHGLLAIDSMHGQPPPACIDALRRFWPSI